VVIIATVAVAVVVAAAVVTDSYCNELVLVAIPLNKLCSTAHDGPVAAAGKQVDMDSYYLMVAIWNVQWDRSIWIMIQPLQYYLHCCCHLGHHCNIWLIVNLVFSCIGIHCIGC